MKNKINIKEITFTGMMIAICIVLRYAIGLLSLPNIQPLTAILILLSIFISCRVSILTGSCVMLITGMLLGFGIWIPLQMIGFAVVSIGSRLVKDKSAIVIIIWGAFASYIYGFIVTLSMLAYVPIEALIPTWISGITFDTFHALSTVVFLIVLYPIFQVLGTKVTQWLNRKEYIK